VKKGQLLATIDAPDLDAQVAQAREQLRQAESDEAQQQAQLALRKVTWDRWRILVGRGVFSQQDGDQRETDYKAQLAIVASAHRNVESYRANLDRVISLQE
jgi:multidrug resistance efflux pump